MESKQEPKLEAVLPEAPRISPGRAAFQLAWTVLALTAFPYVATGGVPSDAARAMVVLLPFLLAAPLVAALVVVLLIASLISKRETRRQKVAGLVALPIAAVALALVWFALVTLGGMG